MRLTAHVILFVYCSLCEREGESTAICDLDLDLVTAGFDLGAVGLVNITTLNMFVWVVVSDFLNHF